MRMKHDNNPNWKEEPTRHLAVVPDWESRMSNHTVAVSNFHEFCITQGEFVRVNRDARKGIQSQEDLAPEGTRCC
jgi:hypothetical protein